MSRPRWLDRRAVLIFGAMTATAIALVALSLRREPPPSYPLRQITPRDASPVLHGPDTVTLDASRGDRWVYFDFARGAPIPNPAPRAWDVAFRRFHVMVNAGPDFAGDGAIADLGPVPFDAVVSAPDSGWVDASGRDSTNVAIARWYDYSFTSHLLTPRPRTYAVRTADGRYAKLRFLSYYCTGATPGCITFVYVYQGDGTRDFSGAAR